MKEHFLLSVLLKSPPNTHFHGYLMGNDQEAIERGCDGMTRICAESSFEICADSVLIVMLDAEGVRLVRKVVLESRRGREGLAAAKDCYFSFWTMGDEDPRAARLLALHERPWPEAA
jgi:hypothetical protein